MRQHLRTLLIAAVTVGLVAWFLRQADFSQVLTEIRGAAPLPLAVAVLTTLSTYALRAWRWQVLLEPIGGAAFRSAFRATVIGFAANSVLPARAGELVRPYLLARRERLSVSATFATIIVERLLDLVVVLVMFASFVFLFDPGMEAMNPAIYQTVKVGGALAGLGALVALGFVAILAGHPERLGTGVDRLTQWLPARLAGPLARIVVRFAEGLAIARDPARLGRALLWSAAVWGSIVIGIWLVTAAFDMGIPFSGSFLVVALLVVGVSVPTPGAVGGFHEAFRIAATTFYAVDNDRAVGAAIVLHAVSILPVTLLGAWFMIQDGLSLGRVRELGDEARHVSEDDVVSAGEEVAGAPEPVDAELRSGGAAR